MAGTDALMLLIDNNPNTRLLDMWSNEQTKDGDRFTNRNMAVLSRSAFNNGLDAPPGAYLEMSIDRMEAYHEEIEEITRSFFLKVATDTVKYPGSSPKADAKPTRKSTVSGDGSKAKATNRKAEVIHWRDLIAEALTSACEERSYLCMTNEQAAAVSLATMHTWCSETHVIRWIENNYASFVETKGPKQVWRKTVSGVLRSDRQKLWTRAMYTQPETGRKLWAWRIKVKADRQQQQQQTAEVAQAVPLVAQISEEEVAEPATEKAMEASPPQESSEETGVSVWRRVSMPPYPAYFWNFETRETAWKLPEGAVEEVVEPTKEADVEEVTNPAKEADVEEVTNPAKEADEALASVVAASLEPDPACVSDAGSVEEVMGPTKRVAEGIIYHTASAATAVVSLISDSGDETDVDPESDPAFTPDSDISLVSASPPRPRKNTSQLMLPISRAKALVSEVLTLARGGDQSLCVDTGLAAKVNLDATHAWSTFEKIVDGISKIHPKIVKHYPSTWVKKIKAVLKKHKGDLWIGYRRRIYGTQRWLWRINKDLETAPVTPKKKKKQQQQQQQKKKRGTKRTSSKESKRPSKKGQAEIDDLKAGMVAMRKRTDVPDPLLS